MAEIYSFGFTFFIILYVTVISACMLYRCYKAFVTFARGEDLDSFDESVVFETFPNWGSNPLGILIDMVVFLIMAGVLAASWPVSFPILVVICTAYRLRAISLREKAIMDTLSGNLR